MAYWMRDNFSIRFLLYVAGGGIQMNELNFGGVYWGLSFRRDYLVYVRIRSWSVFLREPRATDG